MRFKETARKLSWHNPLESFDQILGEMGRQLLPSWVHSYVAGGADNSVPSKQMFLSLQIKL